MTETALEQIMTFEPLTVDIKGNTIGFRGKYSKEQLEAYIFGIEQVLEDASIDYKHKEELGRNSGIQEWEIIGEINADYLRRLIPSIHIAAEEHAEEAGRLAVSAI